VATAPQNPTVSVVIPTYNRLARLQCALDALARQTVPNHVFEVVVVSDGSTDGTDAYMTSVELPYRLIFRTQRNRGPAAARNRGVQLARGEVVLFLDDDVVAAPNLIDRHLDRGFRRSPNAVVIGPMLTPGDHDASRFVRWEQAMLYKQYDAIERGDYEATYRQFYTGNASVARQLLLAAGPFNERFKRAEDVELAYRLERAGGHFVFDRSAVGFHYAERSYPSWIAIARDYGRNEITFIDELDGTQRVQSLKDEYEGRHSTVRWMATACAGRHRVEACCRWALTSAVAIADQVGVERATMAGLSLLYNTTYYAGMAEKLGSRTAFRATVRGQSPPMNSSN
jgi:glycosyltransferase involved in cell wall biosynthesis